MSTYGMKRFLAALLALCLTVGNVAPAAAYAEELDPTEVLVEVVTEETAAEETETAETTVPEVTVAETTIPETSVPEETASEETVPVETSPETVPEETVPAETVPEETIPEETVVEEVPSEEVLSEEALAAEAELYVDTYADFVKYLKVLEGYADSFAASSGKKAGELIVNFIRTGVERYNESLWPQLAGQEITAFVNYVANQDAQKGTTAMALRNIELFTLPNGNEVDFGHMFGTLNIAYINVQASADLGGWAGDICDLLYYSHNHGNVPAGTVDEMAAYIKANCFGVDADDAFGMDDFYGDMDAIYLIDQMKAGKKLSAAMEAYFTAELNDSDRSAYFLNNRFKGLETHEDVRNAVYNAYTSNIGLSVLEADRFIDDQDELRMACCYAFADYVYEMGGDRLEGDTGEEGGENEGGDDDSGTEEESALYTVFSRKESTLAPGITQEVSYALNAQKQQFVYYLASIDVKRDDVNVYANYKDNDPSKGWGMQRVSDQMKAAKAKHSDPADAENYIENYTPVAGINADFYNMSNGAPSGALVMEGVKYNNVNGKNFFAILKDGTPIIGTASQWNAYADQIQEAISGSTILVNNGEVIVGSGSYYTEKGTRSCVGITADGEVLFLVVDGRQEPYSYGATQEESAQIMVDAGCVVALHLDGGGSATYVSKPEGSDEVRVISSPSDGYERSVSSSLMAVSTAVVSNEFAYATISSDYEYLTIGTSLELSAVGVSASGNAAQIPENAVWQVSDSTIGTITDDGVFTAEENGKVDVLITVDDEVVGRKTLNVVVPDAVTFEKDSISAVYGVETELPVTTSYKGSPVAFNLDDIWVYPYDDYAGYVDGITFVGDEEYGKRAVEVWVELNEDYEICDSMIVNLFKADEAIFDFDNVTAGDRILAWNRVISNSTTIDGFTYQVTDPKQGMDLSYTFALDMTEIDIPEKLQNIIYMLPGGDQADATAWDFLMQLAERVSVLTEVRVVAQFDMDLDVDISELKVVNDYFYMKSADLDKATNTVTLICGWVDQTQAIDPDSANPICILSGIKAVPKSNAIWDSEDQLTIITNGSVTYNIFLRANALYNFAVKEENQEIYGLIPFDNQDVIINGASEKGASFGDTYTTFEDSFVLDKTNRQGWVTVENHLYYFVDNVVVEEGIYLLPGYEDPANMYYYIFSEDGSCAGTVTGLFELENGLHYAITGIPKYGWQSIPDDDGVFRDYFFDRTTGAAVDGQQKIDGYTYTFTDCILTRGQIVKDSVGYRYRWAGAWAANGWVVIDGDTYFIMQNSYFQTGRAKRFAPNGEVWYCLFADDGRWMQEITGFYDDPDGETYLIENGFVIEYPGVVLVDGDYYYFNSYDQLVKNTTTWISKPNGLIVEKRYTIDADGKIQVAPGDIIGTTPDEPGDVKNGIVEENGELYYYVNGVKTYAGLIEIDGDYYYVNSSYKVIRNTTYWISKTNGLMPEGNYTFDADGKMVIDKPEKPIEPSEPEEPELKNGIVEEDGELYYYVDGEKTYAGLIVIDGNYYYVNSSFIVIRGRDYWVSMTNGLLEEKNYTFDENGRIVFSEEEDPEEPSDPTEPTDPETPTDPVEPVVKNGIVEENGDLYYYVDGVKTYAGVIVIDGEYYYVNSSCRVIRSCKYWVSKTNGLLEEKSYTFDETGKIVFAEGEKPDEPSVPDTPVVPVVKEGIVEENGELYYYADGVLTYAGLIIIDGEYYYVSSSCKVIRSRNYWITKTNGLLEEKSYTFDETGKIVFAEGEKPDPEPETPGGDTAVKNGIVEENGKLYYYENGVKTYAGLIEIDGYYYYVKSTCEVVIGGKYWITKTNGLMEENVYSFDTNGRMIIA